MTTPQSARPPVAQIKVCPVCGDIRTRQLHAARYVTPGAVRTRVCKPCLDVGADLVEALGLPPDVLLGRALEREADV